MKRLLINIRGTNGSGKTSIVKSFFDESSEPIIKEGKTIAIFFKNYNLIAIGNYERNKNMGGTDLLKNQNEYFSILYHILEKYPNQNIIIEGIMISCIFSTYAKNFKIIQNDFNVLPIVITLLPSPKVCLDNIRKRNNNPNLNPKHLQSKYIICKRNVSKFKKVGIISIPYDNSTHTINQSKEVILKIINYYSKS